MKDVSDFTGQFDRCLMNEPAFCTAACPFGLDVRLFTEKIKQQRLSAAYKQYRDAVIFPEIVSRLCGRPCEDVCPLGRIDSPIDIREMERYVTENAKAHAPAAYNLPPREKSVAIIGAGLSGLACALRLAQKKYRVVVFGRAGSPRLSAAEFAAGSAAEFVEEAAAEFAADIEHQFQNESCDFQDRRIGSRDEITAMGFDAVYVATGEGGEAFGLPAPEDDALPSLLVPRSCGHPVAHHEHLPGHPEPLQNHSGERSGEATRKTRGGLRDLAAEAGVCWISGGALTGRKDVYAIADGAIAAAAIDAFLRSGVVKTDRPSRGTKMALAPLHLRRYESERGQGTGGAPVPAAFSEAERCLGCRCDACKLYCDLPAYADKWPPRIRDEVFATTLPGKAEVKATPAKRLINTDNLSGVFKDVCPAGIDMDALLLAGRQSMHRQEKMPWAFHEFWLRDMEHANGGSAAILLDTRNKPAEGSLPPLSAKTPVAFFPGCQLGASVPELVRAAYDELLTLEEFSLSGIIVRCCGAPAEWAGDEELFAGSLAELRRDWEALGRPALACACPTCIRALGKHMPEIETVSLFEVLPILPRVTDETVTDKKPCNVFDPCAAARLSGKGKSESLKKRVREHAAAMGYSIEPLPVQENTQRCCGFGGQPDMADPAFVDFVRENRASESDLPYICYCMNCREAFLKKDKASAHILELRYADIKAPPELSPSKRRANRELLKASLQKDPLSALSPPPGPAGDSLCEPAGIAIPGEVLARMDADRIISEDVRAVIDHMRLTKESVLHPLTGVRSGSLVIGRTTYWVDYTEDDGILTVRNAYAHRMAVEHEEVWAGATKEQRRQAAQGAKKTQKCAGLTCELCGAEMKEMDAEFSYLGRSFRHRVMRCPACGLAYISEELARGRIREVEMALEDK